jgi:hypothetical protein
MTSSVKPDQRCCLDCGYVIEGLPEARCPECGRAFDFDDVRSFSWVSRTRDHRGVVSFGIALLGWVVTLAGGVLGGSMLAGAGLILHIAAFGYAIQFAPWHAGDAWPRWAKRAVILSAAFFLAGILVICFMFVILFFVGID